ncbi:hypothetical protein ALC57_02733 [Trachymyrmex cornetzi]|uniref:Uncharacterized protein n=1 Tax=Trachymyrmex cornetzi TaxID=471704 RepID=A0A151JMY8_9HYME|nr:hypothetical protein ALC57_02733 [Trachymyrmex cornetzi]
MVLRTGLFLFHFLHKVFPNTETFFFVYGNLIDVKAHKFKVTGNTFGVILSSSSRDISKLCVSYNFVKVVKLTPQKALSVRNSASFKAALKSTQSSDNGVQFSFIIFIGFTNCFSNLSITVFPFEKMSIFEKSF